MYILNTPVEEIISFNAIVLVLTSYIAEKGKTMSPSMRSAQANDTMNKFVAPLSFLVIRTAAMTIMLPKVTHKQMTPKGTKLPKTLGSSKSMFSNKLVQFRTTVVSFPSWMKNTSVSFSNRDSIISKQR